MTTYPLSGPGTFATVLQRAQDAAEHDGYPYTGLVVLIVGTHRYLAVVGKR